MLCICKSKGKICNKESGTHTVCEECRKNATEHALKKCWKQTTEILVSMAYSMILGGYICFHCKRRFEKDCICLDHFPKVRGGLRSAFMFNLENLAPSCKACNTSGSKERSNSLRMVKEGKWIPFILARKNSK